MVVLPDLREDHVFPLRGLAVLGKKFTWTLGTQSLCGPPRVDRTRLKCLQVLRWTFATVCPAQGTNRRRFSAILRTFFASCTRLCELIDVVPSLCVCTEASEGLEEARVVLQGLDLLSIASVAHVLLDDSLPLRQQLPEIPHLLSKARRAALTFLFSFPRHLVFLHISVTNSSPCVSPQTRFPRMVRQSQKGNNKSSPFPMTVRVSISANVRQRQCEWARAPLLFRR